MTELTPDQLAAVRILVCTEAVASEKVLGPIPPAELTAAQCILESGNLQNMPPNSNNPFGIKSFHTDEPRVLAYTHEWFTAPQLAAFIKMADSRTVVRDMSKPDPRPSDGALYYRVQDWFYAFPTLADAFTAHGRLLKTSPLYSVAGAEFIQDRNLEKYVLSIAQHYSTTPASQYTAIVMRIVAECQADIAAQRILQA